MEYSKTIAIICVFKYNTSDFEDKTQYSEISNTISPFNINSGRANTFQFQLNPSLPDISYNCDTHSQNTCDCNPFSFTRTWTNIRKPCGLNLNVTATGLGSFIHTCSDKNNVSLLSSCGSFLKVGNSTNITVPRYIYNRQLAKPYHEGSCTSKT